MADPHQIEDFDPSDLLQRPEGWQQWKARADWLRDQLDEMREVLKDCQEYFERGATAEYGPTGTPVGNEEMDMLNNVTNALAKVQPHDAGPGGPASEEDSK